MNLKRKDDKKPDITKKYWFIFSVVCFIVLFVNIILITRCSVFKEIDYAFIL